MTNFKTGGPWITRFAPSPTGVLHLGNVRAAILNFLLARQSGGKFLLRLEDTDRERSTFASEAAILWSLSWLGLTPDEPVRHQSLRLERYALAVQHLVERGLAYPCFCTEAELERERELAAQNGQPPRYGGRCASLAPDEAQARVEAGSPHVIRLRCPADRTIQFTDLIKGQISVPTSAFGDFVLLRSSGWPSYNLAVVVDDVDMGVNLVLRGEDHLTNTARQTLLYEAMGHTPPAFAHHGLLVDPDGKKLSKRSGALSIPECMGMGLEPLAVVQYLAALSGALPTKSIFNSLDDMAKAFNPFALGRGNAVLNIEDLRHFSARVFRAAEPTTLARALDESLSPTDPWHDMDETTKGDLAASLRENAASLGELRDLLPHFTSDAVRFSPEALRELASSLPVLAALDQALAEHDPATRLDKTAVNAALRHTGEAARVKGKELYHPIRLALTGTDSGPELAALLTLLPAGRIRHRLQTAAGIFPQCNHKD